MTGRNVDGVCDEDFGEDPTNCPSDKKRAW
jgi:hypothetical protein